MYKIIEIGGNHIARQMGKALPVEPLNGYSPKWILLSFLDMILQP